MNEVLSSVRDKSFWTLRTFPLAVFVAATACTFNPTHGLTGTDGGGGMLGSAGMTGVAGTASGGTSAGGMGAGAAGATYTGAFPSPVQGVTSISASGPNATPPIPSNPATIFGGPSDSSRNPQLVYPNDHVLFPPNVLGIEIHWRPGSAANTLYEISFKSQIIDYVIYTRCEPLADGASLDGSVLRP